MATLEQWPLFLAPRVVVVHSFDSMLFLTKTLANWVWKVSLNDNLRWIDNHLNSNNLHCIHIGKVDCISLKIRNHIKLINYEVHIF